MEEPELRASEFVVADGISSFSMKMVSSACPHITPDESKFTPKSNCLAASQGRAHDSRHKSCTFVPKSVMALDLKYHVTVTMSE